MGYVVYKISNLINGKNYIGKSKRIERRFKEHINGSIWCRHREVSLISKAISKYGFENFEFEILKEFEDTDSMNEYESLMIVEHNSLNPNGYNLRVEIDHKNTVHETTKKLLSDKGQGIRHAYKDVLLSDFIGVVPYSDKFRAFVRIKTILKSKTFDTEIEAAEAYDKMVLFLHGEKAKLNFDDKRSLYLSTNLKDFYHNFLSSNKTSQYLGVSKYRKTDKWVVKIDKKRYNQIPSLTFGILDSEIEAAECYDKVMVFYKTGAKLNFPDHSHNSQELVNFIETNLLVKKSKYKGVSKNSKNILWRAYVYSDGKQVNLGSSFHTEEDAHNAILQYESLNRS